MERWGDFVNKAYKFVLLLLFLVLPSTPLLSMMFSSLEEKTAFMRQKKYHEIIEEIPNVISDFDRLLHQLIWQLSKNDDEGSSSTTQKFKEDLDQLYYQVIIMQGGMEYYVDDKNLSLNIEPVKIIFDDMQHMIEDIHISSNLLETYQKLIQLRAYSNTFFALLRDDLSEKDRKELQNSGQILEKKYKQHLAVFSSRLERDFKSLLPIRMVNKVYAAGTTALWAGKGALTTAKKAYELTRPESIKEKKRQTGKFLIEQSNYLRYLTHHTRDEVTERCGTIKNSLQPLVTFLDKIQQKAETDQIEKFGDRVNNQIELAQKICSKTVDITKDIVGGISSIPAVSPSELVRHVVLAPSLKGQIVLDLFAVVEASGLIKDLNKLHNEGIWICDYVWETQNTIHGRIDKEAASAGRYKYPAKAANDVLRGKIGSAIDNLCNELAERSEDLDKVKEVCNEWLQYLDENVYLLVNYSYELFKYLGQYRDKLDKGIVRSEERINRHVISTSDKVNEYLDQIYDVGQELVAQGEMKKSTQRLDEYLTCLKDTYGTNKQLLESEVSEKEKRTFLEQQKMFYGDQRLQSLQPISSEGIIKAQEFIDAARNTEMKFDEWQRESERLIDDLEREMRDIKGERNIIQLRLVQLKNNRSLIDSFTNYLFSESVTNFTTEKLKKRKQSIEEKIALIPEIERQYSNDLVEQTGEKLRREKYKIEIELFNRRLKELEKELYTAQEDAFKKMDQFKKQKAEYEKNREQCYFELERIKKLPIKRAEMSVVKDNLAYPIVWKKASVRTVKGKERAEKIEREQLIGQAQVLYQNTLKRAYFNKIDNKISCLEQEQGSLKNFKDSAQSIKMSFEKQLNPTDIISLQNIFGYCFNRWRAWWYGSYFKENIELQKAKIESCDIGIIEKANKIAEEQDKDDYKNLREEHKNKRTYVYTENEKQYVMHLAQKNPIFWYALHPKDKKRKEGIEEQWRAITRKKMGRLPARQFEDCTSHKERSIYDFYKSHSTLPPEGYTFESLRNGQLKMIDPTTSGYSRVEGSRNSCIGY